MGPTCPRPSLTVVRARKSIIHCMSFPLIFFFFPTFNSPCAHQGPAPTPPPTHTHSYACRAAWSRHIKPLPNALISRVIWSRYATLPSCYWVSSSPRAPSTEKSFATWSRAIFRLLAAAASSDRPSPQVWAKRSTSLHQLSTCQAPLCQAHVVPWAHHCRNSLALLP
jgi:hypothetical protein